jgi:hypothetical protein
LRRIQHVIKGEFDVSYHPDYLLSNFGQTEYFRSNLQPFA